MSRVERQIEKKELQLRKIAHEMAQKDDLKTVALGTSKINYMDPRISVAWCKKHDVPIEKVSRPAVTPQTPLQCLPSAE